MADLTALLTAAANADRGAEQQLEQWVQANYAEVAHTLALEVANEGKPFIARQMACLYLKNTLAAQSTQTQKDKYNRWKSLQAAVRTPIKEALLTALATAGASAQPELHQLPHYCAIAMAEIAVVELPHKEWPQLVQTLMEHVTNPNAPVCVKIAALETLGYTCERIAEAEDMFADATGPDAWPQLDSSIVDQMLTTIVDGVQPTRPPAMRLAALQALKNSLLFVRKNMENKQERDFILQAVCEACAATGGDLRVRECAYQCLDAVADFYYERLPDYMTNIFNLTTASMRQDATSNDENVHAVPMAAMEVWNTIALHEQQLLDEERDAAAAGEALHGRAPCPKYVQAAMEHLAPLLLQTLTKAEDDVEADNWNLQSAGAICLETISQTVEGLILPHVIPFVQQHISAPEWQLRDGAVNAFSCILDGPNAKEVAQYVQQSIPVLLGLFQDEHMVVRHSAVHAIAKMCKLHLAALDQTNVHAILNAVLTKWQDPPIITAGACSVVFNVAKGTKQLQLETDDPTTAHSNVLSAPMLPLMQGLLKVSDRSDGTEQQLRVSAMSAASELVAASAADVQPVLVELLPFIVKRSADAIQMPAVSPDDTETKDQLLGLLCALLQTLFLRMDKPHVAPYADQVVQVLLQILGTPNMSNHEEAFLAMSALADTLEEDFDKYMPHCMPHIISGIQTFSHTPLCIVAISLVVDLCSAMGPKIQPYADNIMEALFACVRDGSVHRDVKPVVISCFGDVALAVGPAYEPYLQLSLMLLMQASQQNAPPDNEEFVAFINKLRAAVLEAYSGIVQGLSEGQQQGPMAGVESSLPNVFQFLMFLASDQAKDEAVLGKAVALLGDVAQEMGTRPKVKEQLRQPQLTQLFSQLIHDGLATDDPTIRTNSQWAGSMLEQAMRAH